MAQISTQNAVLAGVGTIYEAKVQHLQAVQIWVVDNGGGSTITFENSADGTTWNAYTDVFTLSNGALTPLGGSTTTAKGRFLIDARGSNYVRARVSTYVSGRVVTEFQESPDQKFNTPSQTMATGLTAVGTTQALALPLNSKFNVFGTVAATTSAILPFGVPRTDEVGIRNGGANALTLFPPVGGSINGGAANASVSIAAAATARFISDGNGNFWQF